MRLLALLALVQAGCTPADRAGGDPPIDEPMDDPPPPVASAPLECGLPEVHVIGIHGTVPGTARVTVERPGRHILVLAASEATSWNVTLAPDARVREIHLVGSKPQTVNMAADVVTQTSGCGYAWPPSSGCDTSAMLAGVKARTGLGITSFHGCAEAADWTLHADRRVTTSCNTATGQVSELLADCGKRGSWEQGTFSTLSTPSCTGDRFVRYDAHYDVWVGAILCGSADRYKLYMAENRNDQFLEIADFGGHGQDHCELVDPAFKITDDDDITSGGCTTCSLGSWIDIDGVPIYARQWFGQQFERVQARFWADLTTPYYSCGVALEATPNPIP